MFEERLHKAICSSYDIQSLEQMVQFRLNERLDVIVPSRERLEAVVFQLIRWSVRAGRIAELVRHSAEFNPSRIDLENLRREFETHFDSGIGADDGGSAREETSSPDQLERDAAPGAIDQFSDSIRAHMAALHRKAERLTVDQYRVIQLLRGTRRARIWGCAGSGKTLVAAEKAVRLCAAGLRTIFLCHNPLLANHVQNLTVGTGVQVETFGDWVGRLAGRSREARDEWSNLDEPDQHTIELAFEAIAGRGSFDAIIVDEGQDFRRDWWAILEESLVDPKTGILYIFHDDHQAVLPYRAEYPIREPALDLSRNCRNSGRVYELLRCLVPQAPETEELLKGLGEVLLVPYTTGRSRAAIEQAVAWIDARGQIESMVAILTGSHVLEASALGDEIPLPTGYDWQSEVLGKFHHAIRIAKHVKPPPGGWDSVQIELAGLSKGAYPNVSDVQLVRQVANTFQVRPERRRDIANSPSARAPHVWTVRDKKLILWKPAQPYSTASEIILHFEQDTWHKGIPEPETVRFAKYSEVHGPRSVPVYRIGDFKGLEADTVLVHINGSEPISREELYVVSSRARMYLTIVVDRQHADRLPHSFIRLCRPD